MAGNSHSNHRSVTGKQAFFDGVVAGVLTLAVFVVAYLIGAKEVSWEYLKGALLWGWNVAAFLGIVFGALSRWVADSDKSFRVTSIVFAVVVLIVAVVWTHEPGVLHAMQNGPGSILLPPAK